MCPLFEALPYRVMGEALFYKSLEVMRDLVRGAFYKVPRGLCVTLFEALVHMEI